MIGLFALMASAPAIQQAQQADQPPPPAVRGADVCLPMKLADGLPVVPATVEGHPANLIFDTGAPGIPGLSATLIHQLNFKKIGEAQATDPSGRNLLTVGLYELRNLKLGAFSIDKWVVDEHPPQPTRFSNPDGIIGLEAFRGYVVTFDYPSRRILVSKGRLDEPDGHSSFHYEGPIPAAPLTLDGHLTEAHIDTGNARYPVIVPQSFASQLPDYAARFPIGTAHTVNNKYDLLALPIHDSKIGDFPLYAGTVAYPGPSKTGNIGSEILRDMVVRVDPANSIISFERAKPGLEDGCPSH